MSIEPKKSLGKFSKDPAGSSKEISKHPGLRCIASRSLLPRAHARGSNPANLVAENRFDWKAVTCPSPPCPCLSPSLFLFRLFPWRPSESSSQMSPRLKLLYLSIPKAKMENEFSECSEGAGRFLENVKLGIKLCLLLG